jgi:DNA-binding transcriptional regulator YdaS (Cro superfamily)
MEIQAVEVYRSVETPKANNSSTFHDRLRARGMRVIASVLGGEISRADLADAMGLG